MCNTAVMEPDVTAARRTLGAAVVHYRNKLKLSQQALADSTGVSRGYISKVELGLVNSSLDIIVQLAGKLQVDPWELLKPLTDY